jgi:hypothetical protein
MNHPHQHSFIKPFKCANADKHNVYFDQELITKIMKCGKETTSVRTSAWFIVCVVTLELNKNPNTPVTYKQISKMSKNTSVAIIKRAHMLLIELGVE